MNVANRIEYFAADEKRQNIPWIRVTDRNGKVTEYTLQDNAPTAQQIAKAEKRRMDCVDCHNRPTHIYVPPDPSVDRALLANTLYLSKIRPVWLGSEEQKGRSTRWPGLVFRLQANKQ